MPHTVPTSAPAPAWDQGSLKNPHQTADKARRVQRMFSAIAPSYDLNNHLHSLWLDHYWRRQAVRLADIKSTDIVADIACGTGDLSMAFYRVHPKYVIGVDFCHAMLQGACKKTTAVVERGISFYEGDALQLPLRDQSVDVVSIAFGIRNVSDWGQAVDEFHRILRPGGRLIILEFSLPHNPLLRAGYNFYFRRILPRTATLISGDKTGAYQYLPESVNTFISPVQLTQRMQKAGFSGVRAKSLTAGICYCYRGIRYA
ncbi:MAG: bifunctional demethylmenaquinone methyltransferase/2-methoxy-6-polyprenyl-1,4-benzoquinol methylase UbiE [Planctomycetes bacterium]|jgi:demethylmenaquinone methyltransferase/2-methoxy-6-polyprenyl-1,4-benzoquinol methylase|nr:bifunctional demethylmenaquinone methyltransferase/2-methoxy-6-polyprenyl-1,4-benzoquinol methylase UbiE [Planctomycetota bacterium]MDA8375547.1 bifunctional demethylmenaquinone methyltransferase/2-methoxy-6-polyprenyl-1,4-benzoquinol methylase UbiE [Planctomycetia bacterium]